MNSAPWLKPAYDRIIHSAQVNQLAHAVLIYGAPGWGEAELASAIAGHFVGLDTEELQADSGAHVVHPDFHWLQPEAPGKQIKVEQIRVLRNFVLQTCHKADRKVAVIIDAHMMNINAANALLKTLEEPPGECLLILSTNSHQDLLPTIRSRCQSLPIRPMGKDENLNWVRAQVASKVSGAVRITEDELNILLFEFGDAPIFVLQAVQRGEKGLLPDLVSAIVTPLRNGSIVQNWLKLDLDTVLSRWMRYLNALTQSKNNVWKGSESLDSYLQPLTSSFDNTSQLALLSFWDELLWARKLVHSTSNTNQGLLLERLLLRWCELVRS